MLRFGFKKLVERKFETSFRLFSNIILILGVLIFFNSPVLAFDFSGWDRLTKKYVSTKVISGIKLNVLNYKNVKKNIDYSKLITDLKNINLKELKTKNDKLAFWINVYNIMAVKMVLDNYPVESIRDAGSLFKSVWKKKVGVIAG